MENINDILARAAALRDETALNSIDPARAGGIMYDTLIALNDLWLQQGAALVISKIYASVAAMEADTAPVSDLTGQPIHAGQIVVIASSDADNGSVYRFNGVTGGVSSWSSIGVVGDLPVVDSLDSDSASRPLSARQGKVLNGIITQVSEDKVDINTNNLVNPDKVISPALLSLNGAVVTSYADYTISDYIRVKVNTDIYANCIKLTHWAAFCVYDENKQFLRSIEANPNRPHYTYQSGDAYIRISFSNSGTQNEFTANYGSSLLPFSAYNPIENYLPESLSKIPEIIQEEERLYGAIDRINGILFNMAIDLSDNTNKIKGSFANNITNDFSILLWGKITNFIYPNFFVTFQQNASQWSPYQLGEVTFYDQGSLSAGKLTILVGTGTNGDMSKSLSQYTYTSETMNMFAVVRDSTNATLKFYINGELVKTVTDVPSNIYLHKNLQIKNGKVANLMVVNDVLSDSDIYTAYSYGQKYNINDTELNIKPQNVVGNKVYDGDNVFTANSNIVVDYDVVSSTSDAYGGIITPASFPVLNKSWYIAKQAGSYVNFGIVIDNPGVYIINKNGETYSIDTIWVDYNASVEDIVTDDIYILKNTDYILYSDAIINGLDRGLTSPINYYVEYLCAIGKVTNRGFIVNASAEQTQPLTIKVYSTTSKQLIKTINTTLHIVGEDFAGKQGNVVVIGDSTEAGNKYTSPMYAYLQSHNGGGVAFVGTRGAADSPFKDEGYGGAGFYSFATSNSKKLYLGIADDNVEQFHLWSRYEIVVGASTIRFELGEINKSTPGSYYVSGNVLSGASAINDMPSSGVMQKYSGTGSETLTYVSKEYKTMNPFWNPETDQFDMSYYKETIGVQSIDVALVILGINDAGSSVSSVINHAITLYNGLITGCNKVVMVLTTDCASAQSAFGGQYGASSAANNIDYKTSMFDIRRRLLQEFQGVQSRPNAFVCMLGGTIDRFYGYNHSVQQVPYYATETEVVHTDSKHPNVNGQTQGAMTLLGILKQLL